MKTITKLHPPLNSVPAAILIGSVEVAGKQFTIATDPDKTQVSITDEERNTETYAIDQEGNVIQQVDESEYLTGAWTDQDWKQLAAYMEA